KLTSKPPKLTSKLRIHGDIARSLGDIAQNSRFYRSNLSLYPSKSRYCHPNILFMKKIKMNFYILE
ncbi:hypothetical protein M4D76_26315, partial [Peribacillus frigoritolerans]|uniref:hypothetical protein n=1 Tax=Peribacillus frigoritolerans TaxID=450367 RepID=UPI0021A6A42C